MGELPLKYLYKKEEYKGRVGYLYKESDLNKFVSVPFYNTSIFIPNGAKNMLLSDYGCEVFDFMIDKKGTTIKIDKNNSKPLKL